MTAPRLGQTLSVFAVGPAYVPILLLIAGLLALAAFLPGSERSRLAVAAVSVGGAVGAIVSLGTPGSFELFANPDQVSSGIGAILLVVFGIVQAIVAIVGYVIGADLTRGGGRPSDTASQQDGPVAGYPVAVAAYPAGYPATSSSFPAPTAQPAAGYPAPQGYPAPAPTAARGPAAGAAYGAGHWPVPDERATGPQVVVGSESDRAAEDGSRPGEELATRDTGPIPVVRPEVDPGATVVTSAFVGDNLPAAGEHATGTPSTDSPSTQTQVAGNPAPDDSRTRVTMAKDVPRSSGEENN